MKCINEKKYILNQNEIQIILYTLFYHINNGDRLMIGEKELLDEICQYEYLED